MSMHPDLRQRIENFLDDFFEASGGWFGVIGWLLSITALGFSVWVLVDTL